MEGVGGGGALFEKVLFIKIFPSKGGDYLSEAINWGTAIIQWKSIYYWLTHDLHHVIVYFIIIVTVHLFLIELYSNKQKQKSLRWFPVYSHIWNERSW